MDVRNALKEQYHGGLAMLRQCIERCPDEVWVSGEHPRTYWRIAYHAIFYTHLYMLQGEGAFRPWEQHSNDSACLWEEPPVTEPYTRESLLAYLDQVDQSVDATIDGLDLDTCDSGFPWYPGISKLSHEMMNIRHLAGHMGQLSELLMARGIDIDWKSGVTRVTR